MTAARKRRAPAVVEIYGPLEASWEIRWADSGGSTSVGTLDRARATVAHGDRQGRAKRGTITLAGF